MGKGVMTVMSVLGPAMINAHRVAKKSPSGPVLAIDLKHQSKLPYGIQFRSGAACNGLLVLNWIEWQDCFVVEISKSAGLDIPDSANLWTMTREYIFKHELRAEWMRNALAHFEPKVWKTAGKGNAPA
jgi:hypothetical protein